jgi:hypothetical protein
MTLETYKPCKFCESIEQFDNGYYDRVCGESIINQRSGEICGTELRLDVFLFGERMRVMFGPESDEKDLGEVKIKYCPMCGRRLDTEEEIEEFVDRQYKEK